MHEYHTTQKLLDVALKQAKLQPGERISRLRLTLDPDSGYTPESIRFYFEQLAKNTPAEGAELDIVLAPEPNHVSLNVLEIEEREGTLAPD